MKFTSSTPNLIGAVAVLSLGAAPALAQKDRIAGQIDPRRMVVLQGNVHPNARPQFDEGPVDPAMKLNYVTLTLNTSASQQADLDQLLVDQQDPFSPNFHKWLMPEQYADRFGASSADIAKIVAWMQSAGFDVISVARGRKWIAFNGTAQQIQTVLQTQIHHYRVDGELHFAIAKDPWIPAALQPMVTGFLGLDDFRPKPRPRAKILPQEVAAISAGPLFTGAGGGHFLAPGDLATIYNISPLYGNGVDGTGRKIVVVGQTSVYIQDIRQFRSGFGLPANDPQFVLVPGSTDPGVTADQDEANLDLEWSGAIARNAKIQFVYSTNVETSVQYAIDQNLAPVISYSYDICEPLASGSLAGAIQPLAQQANAQGITWLASTGDSGAAGCDRQGKGAQATKGIAVSLPASIPEVTGVGGTEFNEGTGNYWSNTNSTNGGGSALSYIPEMGWNESGATGLGSTGGGLSTFFAKPSWQTGPGVPSANARAVPDVSLTAASGHDGYIVVLNGSLAVIGGTSASTPAFAGLVVLINQYLNSNGLGNINPNLYRLAQSTTGVFHDVTTGNNIVPCAPSSPNCSTGFFGYDAGPGYDPVTGLGSVDGFNLASRWNSSMIFTTTTVTANPANVALNGSTQLTATVKAVGSSGTPTGTVSFIFKGTSLGSLVNSAATITVYASQLPTGSDSITASYSGSNSFNRLLRIGDCQCQRSKRELGGDSVGQPQSGVPAANRCRRL